MSVGRRKARLDDASQWIFNRMADAYCARPPYPVALIDAIAALAPEVGSRIADVGAGIGHLAIPLAKRGFEVTAIEPAEAMLDRLRSAIGSPSLNLRTLHAAVEALPLQTGGSDLVLVADALHFLDKELAAGEIGRVLAPTGALALVISEFADTPFMRGVEQAMQAISPRRPRDALPHVEQIAAIAKVRLSSAQVFEDATTVDEETLNRILCSVSFIGPALNAERWQRFRALIQRLPRPAIWSRRFTLYGGGRRRTLSELGVNARVATSFDRG